jgi:hypothetical protein
MTTAPGTGHLLATGFAPAVSNIRKDPDADVITTIAAAWLLLEGA